MADVTAAGLGKLTVAVLKERLAERGLETKGLKADLVSRLAESLQKEAAAGPGATPAVAANPGPPADDPDALPDSAAEPEARREEPEGAPSEQPLPAEPVSVTAQAAPPPAPPPQELPPAPTAEPPAEREAVKRKEAPAQEAALDAVATEAEPPAAKRAREEEPAPEAAATAAVFVEGLVRPFTNSGLKTLLASCGGVFDESADFWLAPIKNMAVAVYQTAEQAAATIAALNGKEWPVGQGNRLRVRHIPVTDARRAIAAGSMAPVSAKAAAPAPRGGDGRGAAAAAAAGPAKTLESLFKKTQATPRIFWLPVSEEQAARRKAHMAQAKAGPTQGAYA